MSRGNSVESSIKANVGDDVDIHDTKDPDAVYITNTSKIKLVLIEYEAAIKSQTSWVNPALLGITVLSVLFVTDFGSALGLPGDVWEAIFIVLLLLSIIWFVRSIQLFLQYKQKADIEYVIEQLES